MVDRGTTGSPAVSSSPASLRSAEETPRRAGVGEIATDEEDEEGEPTEQEEMKAEDAKEAAAAAAAAAAEEEEEESEAEQQVGGAHIGRPLVDVADDNGPNGLELSSVAGAGVESKEPQAHLAMTEAGSDNFPAVQVCVRLRPLLDWERREGNSMSGLELEDGRGGNVSLRRGDAADNPDRQYRKFRFDTVIGPHRSQQEMWELSRVDGLVERVAAGFHATVFAYGQTGSGKTHTMEGFTYEHHNGSSAPSAAAARPRVRPKATPPEQLGLVPRAVTSLFARVEALQAKAQSEGRASEGFVVRVSFLQIYNEKIHDLLNAAHTPAEREKGRGEEYSGLRMRWDAGKGRFFVENLFEFECGSAEEVLQHYTAGVQNKHVASTAMNSASSRSHTILILTLVRRVGLVVAGDSCGGGSTWTGEMAAPMREVVSKLALVDLAGSERASASGTVERSAARFHEAVNVNQSLFVLRKVITALSKRTEASDLAQQHSHVPYRESKLTSLLQHSLGGSSFLLMLACLSPSDKHYEENLSTLQYASQAASIKNDPTVNIDPKDRLIQRLQAQLAAAHAYILRTMGLDELPEELQKEPAPLRATRLARATVPPRRGNDCRDDRSARDRSNGIGSDTGAGSGKASFARRAASSAPGWPAAPASKAAASTAYASAAGAPAVLPLGASGNGGGLQPPGQRRAAPKQRPAENDRHQASVVVAPAQVAAQASTSSAEGRGLFAAVEAMLASKFYRGRGGRDASTPRSGDVTTPRSVVPQTARTPRSDSSGRRARPPSLPPIAGCAQQPLIPESFSMHKAAQPLALPGPTRGGSSWQASGKDSQSSIRQNGSPSSGDKDGPEASSVPSTFLSHHDVGSRSASADTTAVTVTPSSASRATPQTGPCAAEVDGLWDAVEDLRQEKQGLQAQLRAAEGRTQELQAQLQSIQAGHSAAKGGVEARAEAAEAARAAEAAARAADAQRAAEAARVAEAEKDSLRKEQASMASENQALRREQAALQEKLDVFYRAMALGNAPGPSEGEKEASSVVADLGGQIERFHSQLVLESVSLRNEVAKLKKKKWVLKAVLNNGGENEQRAIDDEVAKLRLNRLAGTQQSPELPPCTD
eukprot:TRINITY_DN14128_c0_g4_i1.p1 TRINITY_DN14128_c0_g4~~TRINITY_DN14128_c0_g4_i1.p1  ORF type:complete len:1108 (-),score=233.43 TRINITY_DN14128_c0_g4_i1:30-3353(-)